MEVTGSAAWWCSFSSHDRSTGSLSKDMERATWRGILRQRICCRALGSRRCQFWTASVHFMHAKYTQKPATRKAAIGNKGVMVEEHAMVHPGNLCSRLLHNYRYPSALLCNGLLHNCSSGADTLCTRLLHNCGCRPRFGESPHVFEISGRKVLPTGKFVLQVPR